MLHYITLGTNDIDAATTFYVELLKDEGAKLLADMGRIKFIGEAMDKPMVAVCVPYNEESPSAGNGNMFAISPGSKEKVDAMYAKAIELGATCDGAPGQRVENIFYGAYVKDLDGNKVCFSHFG